MALTGSLPLVFTKAGHEGVSILSSDGVSCFPATRGMVGVGEARGRIPMGPCGGRGGGGGTGGPAGRMGAPRCDFNVRVVRLVVRRFGGGPGACVHLLVCRPLGARGASAEAWSPVGRACARRGRRGLLTC